MPDTERTECPACECSCGERTQDDDSYSGECSDCEGTGRVWTLRPATRQHPDEWTYTACSCTYPRWLACGNCGDYISREAHA